MGLAMATIDDFWDAEKREYVYPPMSDRERIELAINTIVRHGGHDGDHHKAWVLDQVMRQLAAEKYDGIVREVKAEGWAWNIGIAP